MTRHEREDYEDNHEHDFGDYPETCQCGDDAEPQRWGVVLHIEANGDDGYLVCRKCGLKWEEP